MESIANFEKRKGIFVFSNIEEMAGAVFDLLADEFSLAISEQKTYHLALSGGNTPVKIFEHLSRLPLARIKWDFLHIYWGDERCVPPGHPESNFGNMWNTILKKVKIPAENIHRIYGENDLEKESKRYSEVLREFVPIIDGFPHFNLTLLGIGEDGHTASIFPDAMQNINSPEFCYVAAQPQSGQKRITLSLNVLNNSETVVFLTTGVSKSEILATVLNKKKGGDLLPASFVHPYTGKLHWFLDAEAADKISFK
jgi:6-phosphogluconolactonase